MECNIRNETTGNFRNVKVLIDTGSNINLIKLELVEDLGLAEIARGETTIQGVNGYSKARTLVEGTLSLPNKSLHTTQLIAMEFNSSAEIILGTKSIWELGLVISADKLGHIQIGMDKELQDKFVSLQVGRVEINQEDKPRSFLEEKLRDKYKSVFSDKLELPPQRNNADLKIELIKDEKPIALKPYRFPLIQLEELRDQLEDLLRKGQIKHSHSDWSAPCRFVEKKDTTVPRLVCDFRELNKKCVSQEVPLPRPDAFFHKLRCAHMFSTIDLKSGFHQILLDKESTKLTAFATPFGLYEWLVVPFGLKVGPANFMSFMYQLFRDIIGKFMIVYMDDILIYSSDEKEHFEHLDVIFKRLEENKIIIHTRKSKFFQEEAKFLGKHISNKGIRPSKEKISEIVKEMEPKSLKDLKRILGMAGFYRDFIKNFAEITASLFDLFKYKSSLESRIEWNDNTKKSLLQLKEALKECPTLSYIDENKEVKIYTDASDKAIGATLMQECEGRELPIEFFSKKLNATQRRYSVHERELLAIVKAISRWKHLIFGIKIKVFTDHKPLTFILQQKTLSDKQYRWLEELSIFDIQVDYIEGCKNIIADFLSRPIVTISGMRINSTFEDQIRHLWSQTSAEEKEKIRTKLNGEWMENILISEEEKIVVPNDKRLRRQIIEEAHNPAYMGHLGTVRTYSRIVSTFFWSGLYQDVKNFCINCIDCQKSKHSNKKPIGLLQPIEPPDYPWEEVQLDFLAMPKDETTGFDNLLVVIDRLSKRLRIFPCTKRITAKETAVIFIENIIKLHGFPSKIISDRDPRFTSEMWREIMNELKIKVSHTSAFHPQSNGLAERSNRTIIQILRTICTNNGQGWPKRITEIEIAYNSSQQESIGLSPTEVDTGRRFILPLNISSSNKQLSLQERVDLASQNMKEAAFKQKTQFDKKRRAEKFKNGDLVLIKRDSPKTPLEKKLNTPYVGPFKVIRECVPDVYEVLLPEEWKMFNKFNACRLKRVNQQSQTNQMEELEPPLYIIEKFMGQRSEDGQTEVLVKWKGYTKTSWEPFSIIKEADAEDLWNQFIMEWNVKNPDNKFNNGGRDVT